MNRLRMLKPVVGCSVGLLAMICVGAAVAAAGGLSNLLLRSGEQPGFSVSGHEHVWKTATSYVKGGGEKGTQARQDIKALEAAGFTRAIDEHLAGAKGIQGFSLVVEMGSPAAAMKLARVMASRVTKQGPGTLTRIKVPGIRSARGYSFIARDRKGSDANVYWAVGRCTLGSGDFLPSGKPPATPVIAGVKSLEHRVGTACP